MWIFGYGSLVWKVDFPYDTKLVGYIKGYNRRFYQYSTDHRGTSEKPGRVVTLVPGDSSSTVWGIAYKIKQSDIDSVLNHLDYREKGGYKRMTVTFYPKEENVEPFEITIYLGNSDNINYAGEADLDTIAEQILHSVGPSGSNVEYIMKLANVMREIAPDVNDDHLFSIEAKVLRLLGDGEKIKY